MRAMYYYLEQKVFGKGLMQKVHVFLKLLLRLPFENPSHPLLEAKSDILHAQNLSSFKEITLPSAVIRFRRGWVG